MTTEPTDSFIYIIFTYLFPTFIPLLCFPFSVSGLVGVAVVTISQYVAGARLWQEPEKEQPTLVTMTTNLLEGAANPPEPPVPVSDWIRRLSSSQLVVLSFGN